MPLLSLPGSGRDHDDRLDAVPCGADAGWMIFKVLDMVNLALEEDMFYVDQGKRKGRRGDSPIQCLRQGAHRGT